MKRILGIFSLCFLLIQCNTGDVLGPLSGRYTAACHWIETRWEVDSRGFGEWVTREYPNQGSFVSLSSFNDHKRYALKVDSDNGNGGILSLTTYFLSGDAMSVAQTDENLEYVILASQWDTKNLNCDDADDTDCPQMRWAGKILYGSPKNSEATAKLMEVRGTLNRNPDPSTVRRYADYSCRVIGRI